MNAYKKISNSKVLVTGGAGFIGSNLCEDLLPGLTALANTESWPNKILCKNQKAQKPRSNDLCLSRSASNHKAFVICRF